MIVLDTHAWLWWLGVPGELSRQAKATIARETRVGICSISCYEVAALVGRGRIELDRPVDRWVEQALAQDTVEALEFTVEIALEAALLDRRAFSGDPTDRIIYATARAYDAVLITKDRRIRRFDRATTVW